MASQFVDDTSEEKPASARRRVITPTFSEHESDKAFINDSSELSVYSSDEQETQDQMDSIGMAKEDVASRTGAGPNAVDGASDEDLVIVPSPVGKGRKGGKKSKGKKRMVMSEAASGEEDARLTSGDKMFTRGSSLKTRSIAARVARSSVPIAEDSSISGKESNIDQESESQSLESVPGPTQSDSVGKQPLQVTAESRLEKSFASTLERLVPSVGPGINTTATMAPVPHSALSSNNNLGHYNGAVASGTAHLTGTDRSLHGLSLTAPQDNHPATGLSLMATQVRSSLANMYTGKRKADPRLPQVTPEGGSGGSEGSVNANKRVKTLDEVETYRVNLGGKKVVPTFTPNSDGVMMSSRRGAAETAGFDTGCFVVEDGMLGGASNGIRRESGGGERMDGIEEITEGTEAMRSCPETMEQSKKKTTGREKQRRTGFPHILEYQTKKVLTVVVALVFGAERSKGVGRELGESV
ncbi:hypothetical protein R3P38DRAFT_2797517 [Favolaschia claudopus]|uniref:Uncharacterized protein n=1 Tax=Favolaschia claudopus TaxID=2862362 RepID=A0AAW0A2G8_9AGAR